jgi:hypothetical protein
LPWSWSTDTAVLHNWASLFPWWYHMLPYKEPFRIWSSKGFFLRRWSHSSRCGHKISFTAWITDLTDMTSNVKGPSINIRCFLNNTICVPCSKQLVSSPSPVQHPSLNLTES